MIDWLIKLKEEVIDDDTLFVQEIYNSWDEKNNSVVGDIDIVENKIEIDNWTCSNWFKGMNIIKLDRWAI